MKRIISKRHKVFISLGAKPLDRKGLQGILRFTHTLSPWITHLEMGFDGEPTNFNLAEWGCDGILTNKTPTADVLAYCREHDIPMVVCGYHDRTCKDHPNVIARTYCDDVSICQMAAEHLSNLKLTHFAHLRYGPSFGWDEERAIAFADALARFGHSCESFEFNRNSPYDNPKGSKRRLGTWLQSLPKPIGIFASNDYLAKEAVQTCSDLGIAIPQSVAIVGVDNDEVLCEMCSPTVSSVEFDVEPTGFTAAQLLNDAMSFPRRRKQCLSILSPAKRIVVRQSTERQFSSDRLVSRCNDLIKLNATRKLTIGDLANALHTSVRTLELHFKKNTGVSIAQHILATRIELAKDLLRNTSKSYEQIAELCNFCDASHLYTSFMRKCGKPPAAYRLS